MSTLTLTITSPPQVFDEPLTLAEVETFLGLPSLSPVDEERDYELLGFIRGARNQAELLQGRDLVEKQWDLTLDDFPSNPWIELRSHVSSVDLFQYTDSANTITTMVQATNFLLDSTKRPARVLPLYGEAWPSITPYPSSAILIRFTVTPPAEFITHALKIGMKHLISHWYNGRLPFEVGAGTLIEYPNTVTDLLSAGRQERFA